MSLTQKIGQVIALSTLIFGSFIPTAFSATAPKKNAQESKPQTLLAQSTVESNRLSLQLKNCRRTSNAVACTVLATNISNSRRNFYFNIAGSRVTDFSGNIYELSKITFNKYVAKKERHSEMRVSLSPKIPTKLNFYFPIPQNVNQLVAVEFSTDYNGQIVFRNVNIRR
ncbi:MAG: hypothetical protein AAGG00_11630 [Cyanobacteria bacterium P01_H01_bin.150]